MISGPGPTAVTAPQLFMSSLSDLMSPTLSVPIFGSFQLRGDTTVPRYTERFHSRRSCQNEIFTGPSYQAELADQVRRPSSQTKFAVRIRRLELG